MPNIATLYDRYLAEGGSNNSVAFGVWLIQQNIPIDPAQEVHPTAKPEWSAPIHPGSMASILVGRLQRFVHVLSKPAFKEAGIQTPDEFGLLATLFFMHKATKGKLFRQALMEPTTGSEMIKRMRQDGWIQERENPQDRRSSFVLLTEKGKRITTKAFQSLQALADQVLANLSEKEQAELIRLLQKLDDWHSQRESVDSVIDVMQQPR